jgi:chaperonin GroES
MATKSKNLIIPLADRVLITEIKADKKTVSGIILPDSMAGDDELLRGTVLAVGPGKIVDGKKQDMHVKTGDKVLFKKWVDKIKVEGESYYLATEGDLVATIN